MNGGWALKYHDIHGGRAEVSPDAAHLYETILQCSKGHLPQKLACLFTMIVVSEATPQLPIHISVIPKYSRGSSI